LQLEPQELKREERRHQWMEEKAQPQNAPDAQRPIPASKDK